MVVMLLPYIYIKELCERERDREGERGRRTEREKERGSIKHHTLLGGSRRPIQTS
jgi:hypothetical protein